MTKMLPLPPDDHKDKDSLTNIIETHTNKIISEISDTRCRLTKLEQDVASVQSAAGLTTTTSNRVDFALESLGGSVLAATTDLSDENYSFFSFFGNGKVLNSPQLVIKPTSSQPGDCFAFKGSEGSITIQLMGRIFVDTISIEHITEAQSPNGRIDSAPNQFSVYVSKQYWFNPFPYSI